MIKISASIQWGANKTSDETPAPPVTGRLPLMLSLPAPPPLDGCPCPAEKVRSIKSN